MEEIDGDRETGGVVAKRAPRRVSVGVAPLIAVGVAAVGGVAAGFFLPHSAQAANHPSKKLHPVVLASHNVPTVQAGAQITVTGTATVEGTPDTLSFSIGVSNTAGTAVDALENNNAEVRTLTSALESKGVTSDEIQTSNLSINEDMNSSGDITGFSVNDQVDVTMHRIDEAGAAIDAGAQAVGNDVNLWGITFSISNQSALLAKARADAMVNAKVEATQLAQGAGLALGPVVRVSDQVSQPYTYSYGGVFNAADAATAVPIHPGSQQLSVQVSVVYELVS